MADEKERFCTRCGQRGIRVETETAVEYHCPTGSHGVVWREKKAIPETETVKGETNEADAETAGDLLAPEPSSSPLDQETTPQKRGPRVLN